MANDLKQAALKELARRELERRQKNPAGTLSNPATAVSAGDFVPFEEQITEQQTGPVEQTDRTVISRESGKKFLPVAGAIAGSMMGPGILIPALGATVGGTAGEIGRQKMEGEVMDLEDAVAEGGKAGLGTLAGGLVFKGLGAAANKIFNPRQLSQPAERAANFAKKEGLPFNPPEGGGALAQTGLEAITLSGRLVNQKNANQITQFINRMAVEDIPKLAPNANNVIDDVAMRGQEFFKNIYFPAKEAGQEGFEKFTQAVGPQTILKSNNLNGSLDEAIIALRKIGKISETARGTLKSSDKLGKEIINLRQNPFSERTLDQMETIRKSINSLGNRPEVKLIKDDLIEAIKKDYDDIGAQLGVSARELVETAIGKRAKFGKLVEEFPELKFLAEVKASPSSFLNMLFKERNAAALNEIRKTSPELYRELSDTWLATVLKDHARPKNGMIGDFLNGPELRKWFIKNQGRVKSLFGKDRTKALDNFTKYAAYVTDRANKSMANPVGPVELGFRAPIALLSLPGEAAAYMLSKGLSNPNSQLFKLFTNGFSEPMKKVMRTPFVISGQSAANIFAPGSYGDTR